MTDTPRPRRGEPLRGVYFTVGNAPREGWMVYTSDLLPEGTLRHGYFYAKDMAREYFRETYREPEAVVDNDPNDLCAEERVFGHPGHPGHPKRPGAPWDGGTVEVRVYLDPVSEKPLGAWKVTGEPERWKVEELPR